MNCEIDSLTLDFPVDRRKLTKWLGSTCCLIALDSGELIPCTEREYNAHKEIQDGIITGFELIKRRAPSNNVNSGLNSYYSHDRLIVKLNSKLLKEKYFDGLTAANNDRVIQELNFYEIMNFKKEQLLNARFRDVDIKHDYRQSDKAFHETNKWLYNHRNTAAPREQQLSRPYDRKNNQGIQGALRTSKAISKAPFFKLYNKRIELDYHSNSFLKTYILPNGIDYDFKRAEITIRNSEHFLKHGIKATNFNDLLQMDNESKKNLMQNVIQTYITPHEIKRTKHVNNGELMPNDVTMLYLLNTALQHGLTMTDIKMELQVRLNPRAAKQQVNKLDKLFGDYIAKTEQGEITSEIDSALKLFGLYE